MKVKLSQIKHNPHNTREDYGDLNGLKASIERFGLTQPFLVREAEGGYQIAFGSRRYEALKEMGRKEVEVEVRQLNNADMSMLSLCENIHRLDLNPVEQAKAYQRGIRATGLSLTDLAKAIEISHTTVTNYLRILELPQQILKKQEKYNRTQLICLGQLNKVSSSLRIMLENLLENKPISTQFLQEIADSCKSVYSSILPLKTKKELCGEVIFHDYSALPPENYKDIRIFSDTLLGKALVKYAKGLEKTRAARERHEEILRGIEAPRKEHPKIRNEAEPEITTDYSKRLKESDEPTYKRKGEKQIKKVTDIVHIDRKLNDVIFRVRETSSSVQKAIRNEYYTKASKRTQGKFKTAVNHLVSGIEEILKNG